MRYVGPLALNELRLVGELVFKIWQNNPAPRGGYWMVGPKGEMRWMRFAEIAALPMAEAGGFPINAELPEGM